MTENITEEDNKKRRKNGQFAGEAGPGRKKRTPEEVEALRYLRRYDLMAARKLVALMSDKNKFVRLKAICEVLNRTGCTAITRVELTGAEGGPIELVDRPRDDMAAWLSRHPQTGAAVTVQ